MLKVYSNPKNKTTTVLLSGGDMDAINTVVPRLGISNIITDSVPSYIVSEVIDVFSLRKLLMPNVSKATVQLREGDTYNSEVGKEEALAKAQRNYNNSLVKRFKHWQVAMLKKVYSVNPETFKAAMNETMNWINEHEKSDVK